jgi:L-lactate dehydrogenase complex protein LldE
MEAALFATCLSDTFFPRAPEAVVRLLHREGVKVTFPKGQTCCGQPAFNSGFHDEAREMARNFLKVFANEEYIVSPSGSCLSMVRVYYPELFPEGTAEHRLALQVAGRAFEFSEFLVNVLGKRDLGATYKARATYHRSCHMTRELGVSEPPIALLQHVRGLEYVEMDRADLCCGFGGTFSVRMADLSIAMADEKLKYLDQTGADLLVGSDAGCLMQMGGRLQHLGRPMRVMHLAELLAVGAGLMPAAAPPGGAAV